MPPTAIQTGSGVLHGPWVDALTGEGGAVAARPRDVLLLAEPEQQFELLGEQRVVVAEVVAEEGEGLDERPAADHDLRAPAGQEIHGRVLLEHADRVVGAEHGDGAGQPDALRTRGDRRQHHGGRRDREVGPVVLADAEDVEADLVRELGLFENLTQSLLRGDRATRLRVEARIREGEDADLHHGVLPAPTAAESPAARAPR